MRKIRFILLGIFLSFIGILSPKALYNEYDYYIDTYNITIDVNKDNSFDIKEELLVYFNTSKHGIYRNIPMRNNVERLNGTTSNNYVSLTNVKTSPSSTIEKTDDNYVIRLGDESTLVDGYQTYTIEYNYNIGKDPLKDKDEFYFNLVGPEWEDTVIDTVEFSINMPAEFDESLLGFSSGSVTSTSNNVYYEVDGNTITGYSYTPIYEGDALTIRLELPEGYFSEAQSIYGSNITLSFILPIGCLLIVLAIFYLKCLRRRVIDPIEFYPPDDYNSLEIAFLYKGSVTNEDVISLLVYLADKKYIKIVEDKAQNLFSSSGFTKIIKLKDYDGNKNEEMEFMQGLFSTGDEVTISSLKYNFYKTLNSIRTAVNSKENKNKILHKSNKMFKTLFIILAYISFVGTIILQIIDFAPTSILIMICFITLFYMPFIFAVFAMKNALVIRIFVGLFILFHASMFYTSLIGSYIVGTLPIVNIIIAIICSVIIIVISGKFNYRTEFGNKIYGRIIGFKKFLETAEKDQLEHLVMENPAYFYDILPYTYVLGVSDKWIKKFESIAIEPADWYESSATFNIISFNSCLTSAMRTARMSYSSSSGGSSFSGGGSSGGGSSGGGSGGGGGGSW